MRRFKDFLLWPIWKFVGDLDRKHRLSKDSGTAYVVMGFSRSGTSLVSELVHESGVYFGEPEDLKRPDTRNPRGFFEHNELFFRARQFIKQAGFRDDMMAYGDFRAQGVIVGVKRIFTRRAIMRALELLSKGGPLWGFKSFPIFFYFLKQYLPRYKLIGVYRDPFSSVHSLMRAWPAGRYTFEQGLNFWMQSNKDMLYHLSTAERILIRYEDLFDPETRDAILKKLVSFVGAGDWKHLAALIDPALNRSSGEVEELRKNYPLSLETKEVLKALDAIKI